jgi:glycosyltransferase involved in cell wall biosynthesis
VDCNQFHPRHRDPGLRQCWQVAEGDLVMLHVGRLAPEKNLSLLVGAWQQLRAQRANSAQRVRLVVVGDGPSRAELQRQLPDAVFTGWLNGAALATAYASADIFVFPSKIETFGNVVTEAMASGLAVNAFDSAAAHQHIRDRFSGCIAPIGHGQQFISNLQWLAEDAEGRRSVRIHARHRACQLGWGPVINRFENYLSRAASGQAADIDTPTATDQGLRPGSSKPHG